MGDLAAIARQWGIEPGYHDVFGHWHAAQDAAVQKVVAAMSERRAEPADYPGQQTAQNAYQGDGTKAWGLAVQLYAVRSRRNWGIGDFGDLHEMMTIAAASGAAAIALNPLHTLFLDWPEMASPYAPSSRLFLNPLYIAVETIEEFDGADADKFSDDLHAVRQSELIDYVRVAQLKVRALRRLYDRFVRNASAARREDFEKFRGEHGEILKRLGCFEVLRRRYAPQPWWQWPEPWKNPDSKAIDELSRQERDCGFYEFLQWIADRQLARCRQHAREAGLSLGLYLDLAVGVDPCGFDAWAEQGAVLVDLCVGAPPDELNMAGQDWGLAPFNPHALADDDFAAVRKLLSAVMRHAGAIRLDHVFGLMRMFLIPKGASAADGVYVRFPFVPLLDVVAEESNRHRCIVIGEDLGTVPDGFREAVMRQGLWTYRVMLFERWQQAEFKPPSEYPAPALATFNTHDLPTFRGWMSGRDIAVKREIGLDAGESDEGRAHAQQGMRDVLSRFGGGFGPDSFAAAASFLAAAPCRLVTVAIEDMLDVAEQVNVPGTTHEHPNWSRKLPVPLESWTSQPTFRDVVTAFDRAGRGRLKL